MTVSLGHVLGSAASNWEMHVFLQQGMFLRIELSKVKSESLRGWSVWWEPSHRLCGWGSFVDRSPCYPFCMVEHVGNCQFVTVPRFLSVPAGGRVSVFVGVSQLGPGVPRARLYSLSDVAELRWLTPCQLAWPASLAQAGLSDVGRSRSLSLFWSPRRHACVRVELACGHLLRGACS